MSTWKARGLVLKEINVGECDKIVTLFLKEYGKINVSAKGARKHRSKFLAGTQLFTYADFIIYDGGKFNALAQVDVIENFYDIRNDFVRLCTGTYFLELCDKVILENLACDDVLFLALKSLDVLLKGKMDACLVRVIYEFKFLQLNGYAPSLDRCSHCGTQELGLLFFGAHGLLCRNCRGTHAVCKISETSAYVLRYIMEKDARDVFSFTVAPQVLQELTRAANIFMVTHVEYTCKSKFLLDE